MPEKIGDDIRHMIPMGNARQMMDPAKVADLVVEAMHGTGDLALAAERREAILRHVDEHGGAAFRLRWHDGDVTVSLAGIDVVTVPAWRIAPDDALGPAHQA